MTCPAGSCSGLCGGSSQDCYCDSSCLEAGDCCQDFTALCGSVPSCTGRCGEVATHPDGCSCDGQCLQLGDCCQDYNQTCVLNTCRDRCQQSVKLFSPTLRTSSKYSCFCDLHCSQVGDCCADYQEFCQDTTTTFSSSCQGRCKDIKNSLWRLSQRKGDRG